MWEMSENHCCATCVYSQKPGEFVETPKRVWRAPARIDEEGLFPLAEARLCLFCRESLGEAAVQAVLVRPDGRCAAYHCHEDHYLALHGTLPLEDEELYALYSPVHSLAAWQASL